MTEQVNMRDAALAPVALFVLLVAAFVLLLAPRATLPRSVPHPIVSPAEADRATARDLRRIATLVPSEALDAAARTFRAWNDAESGDGPTMHAQRAFASAYQALTPAVRRAFVAERTERFVDQLVAIERSMARREEARAALSALRALAGSFERAALRLGFVDADGRIRSSLTALRGAYKLRLLHAVDPTATSSVPRVERLAFHGFVASRAWGLSAAARVRAIEEIGRLDRSYPTELAAAMVTSLSGDQEGALVWLSRSSSATVRQRNFRLGIERQLRDAKGR